MTLHKLFIAIRNHKADYLSCKKGKDFEDRFNNHLHQLGYSRILEKDLEKSFKVLKKNVIKKTNEHAIDNTVAEQFQKHFIYQPFGSQSYPDFLVFDGAFIVPIELKYSQKAQKRPMWNSGLPRPNGIYMFGAYLIRDVTFFRGCDVINVEEAKALHAFFDKNLKPREEQFNHENLRQQRYGFTAYVRKAFAQGKTFNNNAIDDFFSNTNREELEKSVIEYLQKKSP